MKGIKTILCVLAAVLCVHNADAQVGTVKKVVGKTTGYFRNFDITGTWVYEGVDVQFQSKKLLKKAGGTIMANRLENSLDAQLTKLGFKEGVTTFKFEKDGKFTNTTGNTVLHGTYEFNSKDETITLKYLNHIPLKSNLSGSTTRLSLLFQTDGFLSMFSFIGGHTGIGVVDTMTSLLTGYDGMMVGLKLRRQN